MNNDLEIDKEFFTKVYWKLQNVKTRFVINYGGADSSKSWSQAQHEIKNLMEGDTDTLVLRKIAKENKGSTYKQIKMVIEDWNRKANFNFLSEWKMIQNEIKYLPNNNEFIFAGLDDVAKLKSIVGIERIWGEEASEFDIEDHYEINRRPRSGTNPQITYTFNPISEKHWIKEHFFDIPEIRKKTTIIFSTVEDNQFVPDYRIEVLDDYKHYDINQYNIYRLGQWGKPGVKRPFAFAFKDKHITHGLQFNYNEIVCLSFDFNVDPITCLAAQHNYKEIRIIKEFRLANSDIYELCAEILQNFEKTVYFRVTGDASGRSRTAITKGNINYYTIIRKELGLNNRQFSVPASNPGIKNTRVLLNTLLMKTDFLINDTCRFLIDDLRYVEVNEHGEVDKIKAEKEGMNHLLDCLRYYCFTFHNRFLKNMPKKLQNN